MKNISLFKQDMSKNLKILLVIFSVAILFGALFYWNEFRYAKIKEEIQKFGQDIICQCTGNNQCISVEMLGCSKGCRDSINKRFKRFWDEQQKMRDATEGPACPAIFYCPTMPSSGISKPACVNNRCRLISSDE